MKTFFLITNASGMKYWSYFGTMATAPEYATHIAKHGNIYINDCGGWFDQKSVKEVHAVLIQKDWPTNTNL